MARSSELLLRCNRSIFDRPKFAADLKAQQSTTIPLDKEGIWAYKMPARP